MKILFLSLMFLLSYTFDISEQEYSSEFSECYFTFKLEDVDVDFVYNVGDSSNFELIKWGKEEFKFVFKKFKKQCEIETGNFKTDDLFFKSDSVDVEITKNYISNFTENRIIIYGENRYCILSFKENRN